MRRYHDFLPLEDHVPDMDDQFAAMCLDSLGAGAPPVADAEVDEDDGIPDAFEPRMIDYPGVWDEPEAPEEAEAAEEPEVPETPETPAVRPTPVVPATPAPAAKPVAPAAKHAAPKADAPAAPKKKKAKKRRGFFVGLIPQRGDSKLEIVRKCICIVAILVFVGSACVLLDDFVLTPLRNKSVTNTTIQNTIDPLTPEEANFHGYPAGILERLKKNYYHNHDLIGWITYPSESTYWYGIDYAVVQRPGDNDYYLKRDFDRNENKNGSIFMDYRCDYATRDSRCRVTFIYGHNMRDGQMFASLNQLLDLSMARCSPTFTFSSLFEENQYKVFAVFNVDTTEAGAYDFLNQSVATDDDFVRYIAEMRVRSWFDYNSVDVSVSDEIVLLYTCSNTYQTTMGESGRTIVAARKVRPGESVVVDSSTITENPNCVMPKVWYANKGLSLPDYYQNGVPASYLNAVSRTTPSTAATTKSTTKVTTKPTTTTTTTSSGDEPEEDDDDDVIAPTASERTTRTAAPTTKTTQPTTKATEPEPTQPEPTEPTEPVPTEPEPTEPTEPEPTEPSGPQGPAGPDQAP